jgi:hypothetical protein
MLRRISAARLGRWCSFSDLYESLQRVIHRFGVREHLSDLWCKHNDIRPIPESLSEFASNAFRKVVLGTQGRVPTFSRYFLHSSFVPAVKSASRRLAELYRLELPQAIANI